MRYPNLALMTDFGDGDGYVVAMKGVILGIAPKARLLDIDHRVSAQDVAQGADLLCDVVPYLPEGTVVIAVVDPGVGTARRSLAIEWERGQQAFVGPDNGLLWPVVGARTTRIHAIENTQYMSAQVSPTFHGRDVFAPAAAHLARGVSIEQLGPAISDMMQLQRPTPVVSEHAVAGQIMRVDHFGNLISNISEQNLPAPDQWDRVRVVIGDVEIRGILKTYALAQRGQLLATVGGFARLEISVREGSARDRLAISQHANYSIEVSW